MIERVIACDGVEIGRFVYFAEVQNIQMNDFRDPAFFFREESLEIMNQISEHRVIASWEYGVRESD